MKRRYPNYRLAKGNRNYTVEEVAALYGMHKNTVRRWVKEGLPLIDSKRPMLILGRDLVEFLKKRRDRRKQHCQTGEIYCVRCRAPRRPAGDMAEYIPHNEQYGNLMAICPDCDAIMNRRTRIASLPELCRMMEITMPEALRHIIERTHPTVNSYFHGGR